MTSFSLQHSQVCIIDLGCYNVRPEFTRRAWSTEGYISFRRLRVCRFGPKSGHSKGHFPGQSGTPDFDQNVFVRPPWNFLLCISICKRGHSMFFWGRFLFDALPKRGPKTGFFKKKTYTFFSSIPLEVLKIKCSKKLILKKWKLRGCFHTRADGN